MKKYTDLSFVEAAQALEDGKYVEWADTYPMAAKPKWRRKTAKNVNANFRYRLVEEAGEEWVPEVGDMVLVKNKDDSERELVVREYRGVVDGKYFCRMKSYTQLVPYYEIAPIKKEKREPRVIYVPKNGGGQYFISPDRSRIKFVEEI